MDRASRYRDRRPNTTADRIETAGRWDSGHERSKTLNEGGLIWLAATNLIIWAGLFFYLLRIDRKLSEKERDL